MEKKPAVNVPLHDIYPNSAAEIRALKNKKSAPVEKEETEHKPSKEKKSK